jgi:hypothetical protein
MIHVNSEYLLDECQGLDLTIPTVRQRFIDCIIDDAYSGLTVMVETDDYDFNGFWAENEDLVEEVQRLSTLSEPEIIKRTANILYNCIEPHTDLIDVLLTENVERAEELAELPRRIVRLDIGPDVTSLEGIPEVITKECVIMAQIKHYKHLPQETESIFIDNVGKGMLNFLQIKGLQTIGVVRSVNTTPDFDDIILDTIWEHYRADGTGDILDCKVALIERGFGWCATT